MARQQMFESQQRVATCPACETPNPATANFCGECGTRLARPDPAFLSISSYLSPRALRN